MAKGCACFSVGDGNGKGRKRLTLHTVYKTFAIWCTGHDAGELKETTFAAAECQERQGENFTVNVTFDVQIQNHKVLTFLVNINWI